MKPFFSSGFHELYLFMFWLSLSAIAFAQTSSVSSTAIATTSTSTSTGFNATTINPTSTTSADVTVPTASWLINQNTMSCNDINGGTNVDDPWFSHALCAVLNASYDWLAKRMFTNILNYNDNAFIVIWSSSQSTWQSQYITQSTAAQQGLQDDANGFDWWPAAWRMAAEMTGFPGQVNSSGMAGGSLGTGLTLLTGLSTTVANVTGLGGLSQNDLATIMNTAPGSPVIVSTNSNTSTLIKSSYYTVFNFSETSNSIWLDGLDGNNQPFSWTGAYADIAQVAYLTGSPVLATLN